MNYETECSFFEQKLANKLVELERAKSNNGKLQELQTSLQKYKNLESELHEYRNDLSVLNTVVSVENKNFRNRRITHLNAVITDAIREIFPDRSYNAKIICDFNRKDKAYLVLEDANGNVHLPEICEGKFLQYLISFSAIAGITHSLGGKSLFVDEAFGVGATDILPKVGETIQEKIDNGFQILLISQNAALYNSLPRHEIHLQYDPEEQAIGSVNEIDY